MLLILNLSLFALNLLNHGFKRRNRSTSPGMAQGYRRQDASMVRPLFGVHADLIHPIQLCD